ncbi:hypothetical protein LINPERHAP1_LOCUS32414 [Linum perenne]
MRTMTMASKEEEKIWEELEKEVEKSIKEEIKEQISHLVLRLYKNTSANTSTSTKAICITLRLEGDDKVEFKMKEIKSEAKQDGNHKLRRISSINGARKVDWEKGLRRRSSSSSSKLGWKY